MTLSELARAVGKTPPAVIVIQRKYDLRNCRDYSEGYAVLLRKVIYLSVFSVSTRDIKTLIQHEQALLELLKVDSIYDASDWFESVCTARSGPTRLLLTGYDVGHPLTGDSVQTGLDFKERPRELFDDREMGADVLHGLRRYNRTLSKVHQRLREERKSVRTALDWCQDVTQQ